MAKTSEFLSETRGKLNDSFQTRQTVNGTTPATPTAATTSTKTNPSPITRARPQ